MPAVLDPPAALRTCPGILCRGACRKPTYYFHPSGICIECHAAVTARRERAEASELEALAPVRPALTAKTNPNPPPRFLDRVLKLTGRSNSQRCLR